ncbi:MAG TPA: hypothetical protein ENH35_02340 [Candidatus Moranbacteria bacterium]|nr:hypothetical protein [Candidatus Moranbacteria bacterium]
MTLRLYLWGMKLSTVLAIIAWGLVIYYIDPENSGFIGQILFYSSFYLVLTGIFTLIFTLIRKKLADQDTAAFYLGTNFRQGALVALLAIILLLFQSLRILTWWDGLLVVAGIFIIELYFLNKSKTKE